jgi:hypothetical protein
MAGSGRTVRLGDDQDLRYHPRREFLSDLVLKNRQKLRPVTCLDTEVDRLGRENYRMYKTRLLAGKRMCDLPRLGERIAEWARERVTCHENVSTPYQGKKEKNNPTWVVVWAY